MLYSGLLRRKNALSMLFLSLAVYSVISVQWFFWCVPPPARRSPAQLTSLWCHAGATRSRSATRRPTRSSATSTTSA